MGRSSDAKERILESAEHLFSQRAASAVSVADICKAANVRKGSFYHFFPAKRDLLISTIERYQQQHCRVLTDAFDPALTARQQVDQMFQRFYTFHRKDALACGSVRGCPTAGLVQELACEDTAIREKLSMGWLQWEQRLSAVLSAGVMAGELTLTDPARTAQSIVAYAEGLILMAKAKNDPAVIIQLAPGAQALIDAG